MRLLLTVATAALLAFPLVPAFAQGQPAETAAPPAGTPITPATPSSPAGVSRALSGKAAGQKHQTLQQRFDAANTSHDGHLTEAEASAAKWSYVDKHFSAMDKGSKGYVTVEDIHAFARSTHAARPVHAAHATGTVAVPKLPGTRPVAPPTAPTPN